VRKVVVPASLVDLANAVNMQLELSISKPFIDKEIASKKALEEGYERMWQQLKNLYPSGFDVHELFRNINHLPDVMAEDVPAFPMSILVGEKDQAELSFTRIMEEEIWDGFTVEFHYEIPLDR
jgi:hypothetical protein